MSASRPDRQTEAVEGRGVAARRSRRWLAAMAVATIRGDEDQPTQSERQQVLDETIERAWKRLDAVFEASEFRGDDSVRDEIRRQLQTELPTTASPDIRRALDAAITAEREIWKKRLRMALIRLRARLALALFVLYLPLYFIGDYLTGPGDVDTDVDYLGVGGLVLDASLAAFALSIGLAVWAGLSRVIRGGPVEDLVSAPQQEREQLVRGLDHVLDREWAGPVTSRVFRERQNPNFRSLLRFTDATALGGATTAPVRTPAFRWLDERVGGRGGVSIGVCGPRGVGKSTLLTETCKSSTDRTMRTIGFVKDVPVAYDHVEFLRSLFASLVNEVERFFGLDQIESSQRRLGAAAFGAAVLIITTTLVVDLAAGVGGGRLVPAPARVAVLGFNISIVTLGLVILLVALVVGWLWWLARRRRAERPERELRATCQSARQSLAENVTTTTSMAASIGWPPGASLGRTAGKQVARGAVSHPDLAAAFREFVARVNERRKVRFVIGIDELDKLTSDEARTFLNGLKAIFGFPGTSFVVSVSEDAMSDFERRGLPIRDAFDSSLDEVLRVREMSIDHSMQVLSARSDFAFPLAFGALCHSLSEVCPAICCG